MIGCSVLNLTHSPHQTLMCRCAIGDATHTWAHSHVVHPRASSPTGSEAERKAVETAARYGTKAHVYAGRSSGEDVVVSVEATEAVTGQDMHLSVALTNRSTGPRSVSLNLHVAITYYTGVSGPVVKQERRQVELPPNGGKPCAPTPGPCCAPAPCHGALPQSSMPVRPGPCHWGPTLCAPPCTPVPCHGAPTP